MATAALCMTLFKGSSTVAPRDGISPGFGALASSPKWAGKEISWALAVRAGKQGDQLAVLYLPGTRPDRQPEDPLFDGAVQTVREGW
jgi:hypothetical protein